MLAESGETSSQRPEPCLVSGDGLYTPQEGYAIRNFFALYVFFGVYGSVTGKEVGYRFCHCPPPNRMWI
jgi:hypothetical protein